MIRHVLAGLAFLVVLGVSDAFAQAQSVQPCSGNPCLPASPTSPIPSGISQGGNTAGVSVDGNVGVNPPPFPHFFDAFSTALDTTTNWTANNSTGTAATSAGSLLVSSSTTNAAWGGVGSKQSFAPAGVSPQVFGVAATFATSIIANTARIFGVATIPGSPTPAVPVTDGYIWRLDATGALFAEIWAAGVAVSSTNVTAACKPADGTANLYGISYRTNLAQFTCGTTVAATISGINPANQTLPISLFSIAGTSPGASATVSYTGVSLTTFAPAGVKPAVTSPTINDPALVVSSSPNGADPCSNRNVAKSSVAINITSAATTQLVAISGTTSIYVCHFSFTISEVVTTPNTLQFEYGTSTNCTGANKLTGLYGAGGVTAGDPISVSAGYGGTLFSVPASNGLCALTAIGASGSFQGLLTYVQQ